MVRISGLVLSLICVAGLALPARAIDLASMQPSEIEALQRRLTDAKCYAGPLDGQSSPDVAAAIAACPAQDPQLRIETGMHVAQISRIGVDQHCSLAATASDDKTVRLWSLPDAQLLRTLRVPIGSGDNGKVYAVALSPDGHFVAAAGADADADHDGNGIYIFDAQTGTLIKRVGNFGDGTNHLAFSPDGRFLAAALLGHNGVRVFETATWTEAFADSHYGGDSYGVTFGPDGRLYTVAYDGKLRRYGPAPGFRKEGEVVTRSGRRPFSVAVDPTNRLVAVGFDEAPKLDIFDAGTLALRHAADTRGLGDDTDVSAVAWSPDGSRLVAAGAYFQTIGGVDRYMALIFNRDGRRIGSPHALSRNTIHNIEPCGADLAFSTADPLFGLLDPAGTVKLAKSGVAPDMRGKLAQDFTVSPDAKKLRFGLGYNGALPVVFDVAAGTLAEAPAAQSGLTAPRTTSLPVEEWEDNAHPTFGGKVLRLDDLEQSHAVAIRADRTGFVLGTEYALRSYDASGRQRWRKDVPGGAWGVNLSADGEIIVAAYDDGTIRWHRWSDGQEVLALFVNRDSKAWVLWTPSGYYQASPGGEELIGWHINRGWDQAADFFPASRFREKFNRPDIVALALETLDESEAVRRADAAAKRREVPKTIIESLPPVINILSPADGSEVDGDQVEIRYNTRSPSGKPVDRVEAFVDGAKVLARGLVRTDEAPAPVHGEAQGSVTLPMPPHDATISLVAYADGLAGDAVRVSLRRRAAAPDAEPDVLKPVLYALLIGVTHYQDTHYDLAYPAEDASGLAEAFETQKGKLYKDVVVKILTDKDATATAIKRGLTWLRKQTTAHDLAVVFAAGHGTTDAKGKFWFLPYDMDPDDITATAVSRDDISDVLFDLPGKKLLFLDACHSGAALNQGARGTTDVSAAISDFAQAEGGVVAYAASTGREFSFERDEWGHGAFTKALIEGIEGKADLLHHGTVTTASLDAFLEDRVKQLTDGQQHPVMTRPKTVPDFPIALDR